MSDHGTLRNASDDARHWLPSQGVDPAPLTELNAECLGLLAEWAARTTAADQAPPLVDALRAQWLALPGPGMRRLAAAPFSLFDAGFANAPRWLEHRGRAVHDHPPGGDAAWFEGAAARSITRRMLVYGWHLARSRPRAACLVFGGTPTVIDSLAACSLTSLEAAAERNSPALRPRWSNHLPFWRELLVAASGGADSRLRELLLGGVQRLAAESLAAHAL